MKVSIHLILTAFAIVFFALAAFSWVDPWPWRTRLIAAGLFCWCLSTIVTA
jgi:hypothetical protein